MLKKTAQKALIVMSTATLTACTTINPYTGEQQTAKASNGALIGAGIGGLAGGGIGYYMDVQEAELRRELADTGIVFQRQGNNIVMAMQGNVTFDVSRANIKPQFYTVLNRLSVILKKRNQTFIEVAGHTDSTGSDSINIPLSRDRANTVASYLANQGINPARLGEQGMGSAYPIASNATEAERQLNRRVEITLVPIRS